MIAVHTAPLWEKPDGERVVGMRESREPVRVVGWVNAARIRIDGETRWFLLTLDAAR